MAKYVETEVQIVGIHELDVKPPLVFVELKELDDEKAFFHHKVKLHIRKDKFPIPFEKRIESLQGKKLKLVLQD